MLHLNTIFSPPLLQVNLSHLSSLQSPSLKPSSEAPSNLHFLCRSPSASLSLLISLRASHHHHHRTSSSPCCARCRSSMISGSGSGDSLGSASLPCHGLLQLQRVKALSLRLSAPSFLLPAFGRSVQLYLGSRGAAVACGSWGCAALLGSEALLPSKPSGANKPSTFGLQFR